MLVPERKRAQSTGLSKTVLMFYLSNGPCKLAPLRPEIHIFSRTHQFSIRQVITEKIPKGSFDFCTFQTQLYFIPARMMWRMAEGSEGELRACRGNGAENSSQSKVWGRRGGGWFLGQRVGERGHSHPREEGGQSPCPWGGGADSRQTSSTHCVLRGTFTLTAPLSFPLLSSSCSSLDYNTVKT